MTKLRRERPTYWWREETRDLSFDRETHTLRANTEQGQQWKSKEERYAHAYELAKRADPADEFPPYNSPKGRRLVRLLRSQLKQLEPDVTRTHRLRSIPIEDEPDIWDPENWGPLDVDWNFTASLEAATKAFRQLYEREQRRRGISRQGGPRGQKMRNPSWRWVELIDEARSSMTPKHGTERSKLSEARKAAKYYRAILLDSFGL